MEPTKFKVGDRVTVNSNCGFKRLQGKAGTIEEVHTYGYTVLIDDLPSEDNGNRWTLVFDSLSPFISEEQGDTKATNPKDAIGSTKLPLNLVPDTLVAMAALAFTEGATKYGAYNWRVAGVRASIYEAALKRHLMKWWNGEDSDPTTGVPHLASVIACAGIILDAALAGKLTDDRPPKVALGELVDSFESKVKHLKELHADKNPHHHTALDSK